MLALLRKMLKPPIFEGNESKNRTANVLNTISLMVLLICVVSLFVPFLPGTAGHRTLTVAAILVVNLGALFLMHRGMVQLASIVVLSAQWLVVTAGALAVGGFGAGGYGACILLILIAGLLLGPAAGFFMAGMSAIAGLAIIVAEQQGFNHPATAHSTAVGVWVTQALLFFITAVLQLFTHRFLAGALRRSETELAERRLAELALRRERALLNRLMETSPVGIVTLDRDGQITFANSHAEKVLGSSKDQLINRSYNEPAFSITDVDGNALPDEELPFRRVKVTRQPVYGLEHAICWPGGRRVLVSINATPIFDETGEFDGIVAALQDVTDRRRDEVALHESEDRFRRLSEAAFEGIGITEGGKILDANAQLAEMLGCSFAELIGKDVSGFIAPESMEFVLEHIKSGSEEPYEHLARRADGVTFPVEVRGRALPFGGRMIRVTAIRDITQRKRGEEDRARLATAIESLAEMVIITDTQGMIQYVNHAFERLTGYSRDEVMGQTPRILKSGKHADSFFSVMWKTITGGGIWTGSIVNRKRDGSLFTQDAAISPVRSPRGEIVGYVAAMRDITQELALEEQLRQSQKMEVVGHLAGGIAHDFNNLLAPILGYTEMVLMDCHPDDPRYRNLAVVKEAAERAASLTRQLLSFSRKQILEIKTLNLDRIVADFERMLRRTIPESIDIKLQLNAPKATIRGDQGQIEQVLMNLVVNARDAMPVGGTLTIATSKVLLTPAQVESMPDLSPGWFATVSVADDGIGMGSEILEHIFEPFFTTKEQGKGTGLGLPMVYGLVKQHKGSISVSSALGSGSTFTIYLPEIESPSEAEKTTAPAAPVARGCETIVVVEDNDLVRRLTGTILRQQGYEVIEFGEPETCAQFFVEDQRHVHLLVTDVIMPGMNGKDLYERILYFAPHLKVLYISGYAEQVLAPQGVLGRGMNFLQKPFSPVALTVKVQEALAG